MSTSKPIQGPTWYKNATIGATWNIAHPDGFHWEVVDVQDRGRRIEWRCAEDGRTAITICTPGHPDYPPDPTPEQLRKESLERLAARPVRRTY